MGKKVSIVLFLILIASFAFAKTNDSRLIIGSGNDKFTFGLAKNDDDYLSFSGHIEYDINILKIKLDMNAYTDRGSWPNGQYRSGRLDVVSLSALAHHVFPLNKNWNFYVDGIVGFSTIGKIYFDTVQNSQHQIAGVESAEMPYDWDNVKFSPTAGINFSTSLDFGALRYKANVDFLSSIYFVTQVSTYLQMSAFEELFSLSAGYKYAKNFSESQTIETVTSVKTGAFTSFSVDASPFMLEWEFYPQSGFGYGTYRIDLLPIIYDSDSWKKSDVYFDYSWTKFFDMDIMKAGIKTPITDQLEGVLEIGFVSGFPISSTTEERVQRNYALYELGVSYSPFKWHISPYIQAQMGVGAFQVVYKNSTNPNKSSQDKVLPRLCVFTGDVRVGLNIFPEGFISFGNTSYQLQVYGGSHIIPTDNKLTDTIKLDKTHAEDWTAKLFSPYWGMGLSIGIDVEE